MCPRSDQQPGGHAPAGQDLVLLQGLLQEQILPAPDEQDRHRDPLQRGPALQRGPERVGQIRVLQPALEPRGPGAEQVPAAGRHGQPVQRRTQPPVGGGHPPQAAKRPGRLLMGDHVAPPEEILQIKRTVVVGRPAEIMGTDLDHGGDQFRWRVQGQGPSCEPEVAQPVGCQPPVEPVLAAQPGHGVLAVGGLAAHRVEVPARAERAAAALQQYVEAALGDQLRAGQAVREPAPVGRADQHRSRVPVDDREVVVGPQHRTVGHRHGHVPDHGHPVAPGRQGPGPPDRPPERGGAGPGHPRRLGTPICHGHELVPPGDYDTGRGHDPRRGEQRCGGHRQALRSSTVRSGADVTV